MQRTYLTEGKGMWGYDQIGILVDNEIDLSTRNGKTRVFINKTLSKETSYHQDVIITLLIRGLC
jgi:hypothetical protein